MFNDFIYFLIVMQEMYKEWFEFIGINLIPTAIILIFIFFMLLELVMINCKQSRITMLQSYLTNIPMFIVNNLVLSMLSVSSLLILAEQYQQSGLLITYSQPAQIMLSFVLFDFILYLWHKANHNFDCLWLFHKTHHCDKSMNVSTAFRVHFIEVLLTTLIKALFIIVTGVDMVIVAICEMISTVFVMFHHLNIPVRGEKWLKWLFIVPSLHRVHHSELRKDHDSNYGAVFSLWDRMFRTIIDAKPVEVGLVNVKALNFYELLKFGIFSETPTTVARNIVVPENINEMISEAAFYKAEKRGFVSGFEVLDWLEAEREMSEFVAQPI